ncbi:MAG: MFS transporter [Deltaproteobacteria bacterium]|nr:MAG: MFS transporter [Deltaproteobacteria bacterium]
MSADSSVTAARTVPLTRFEEKVGHPPGLFFLFFTEMWERFSYYGMRGLLVLYMVNYLFVETRQARQGSEEMIPGDPGQVIGLETIRSVLESIFGHLEIQPLASQLYGLYTGLVYLTPVLGGYIADRYLGQRKTVFVGGILMAIGHFLMASEAMFFFALLFLIFGNGFFKPNISTQVGGLYPEGDHRRDRAFSIFYVGINLGAFLSNLVCGTLAAVYGWHWGFGAAGVGMMAGLVIYTLGQRHLAADNVMQKKAEHRDVTEDKLTPEEWRRVIALCALCGLNIVFWAVYEQQGNTMQLWADEQTIWPTIFGFTIPSTWFQSFNPFVIMLGTPLLLAFWKWQERRGKEPSSVAKMAIGSIILGLSFLIMVWGAHVVGDGKGSMFWPLACTLMLTVGELYLSPVGLSLVTKVAPIRIVSLMMGVWFLSSFLGNYLSGLIGSLYGVLPRDGFFMLLTVLGVGTGLAMWAFNKPLKKALGHEV